MKKFLVRIVLFAALFAGLATLFFSRADGYTDPFYVRFTTPKQENLILGTSRAAQGLLPEVLDSICGVEFFNYSFSGGHSPYGAVYLKSVSRKLKKSGTSSTFILTVDPWSISSTAEDPNDQSAFRENGLMLDNTPLVNMNPNGLYLVNNFDGKNLEFLTRKKSRLFVHNNGWLEVSPDMDSLVVERRILEKVKAYRRNVLPTYAFSELRLAYLKETIEYLDDYGDVFLVRLPLHPEMMKIEQELMPDFDAKIQEVLLQTKGYLDLTARNSEFVYTDGNHLFKASGQQVSVIVAEWISGIRKAAEANE